MKTTTWMVRVVAAALVWCGAALGDAANTAAALDATPAFAGAGGGDAEAVKCFVKLKYKGNGVVEGKLKYGSRGREHRIELLDRDGNVVAVQTIIPNRGREVIRFDAVACQPEPHTFVMTSEVCNRDGRVKGTCS